MGVLFAKKNFYTVELDFTNLNEPTDAGEKHVYRKTAEVLAKQSDILKAISEYKGCQEERRVAMQTPSDASEMVAFEAVLKVVASVKSIYLFAQHLEECLPQLMVNMARAAAANEANQQNSSGLDKLSPGQMALAYQMAQIITFTIEFDQIRMIRPQLSNDFSYYRRSLQVPKFARHPKVETDGDVASSMAMFTASPTPMILCMTKAARKAANSSQHLSLVLSTLANSCCHLLSSGKAKTPEMQLFCARAMTGALVLFDLIDGLGAFHKKSAVDVVMVLKCLKGMFSKEICEPLVSSIKYSTKHYKEASQTIHDLAES